MRAIDIVNPVGAPEVPRNRTCRCRVPRLVPFDNYFSGWGETWCERCERFYAYGVTSARKYAYTPRLGGIK